MAHPSLRAAVVVITGASSGNGRATARAFARQGTHLVLAARREEALSEAATECEQLGGRAIAVPTDVSDAEQMEELGRRAVTAFGRIDIWINNAGVLHLGRLDETPVNILHRVIETNLFGCMHGSRVALRHFRRRHRGTLINTSSVLGLVGQPYAGAYVATKFAIRGMSEVLRQETLDEPDIHVCVVMPAAIDTPIYQHAANYTGRAIRPIIPTYDPQVVADTMLSLARHPRREVFAGSIGPAIAMQKTLAPALTERAVRFVIDRVQLRDEAAAQSDGNVYAPCRDRWKARGGWRRSRRLDGRTIAGLAVAGGVLALLWSSRRAE